MLALGRLQSHRNPRYMTVLPNKEENPRLLLSNMSELVGQYQILPFSNTQLLLCNLQGWGKEAASRKKSYLLHQKNI